MNARAATSRRGGSNVRAASTGSATRGSCIGGRPEPRGARLRRALARWTARATRRVVGHRPARADDARSCRRTTARPPTRGPRCIQPPPTSYGASWVSSARKLPSAACMSFGMPVTVDASTRLPDRRAEPPQPERREEARVEREERAAGAVGERLDQPGAPADPAVDRVVARRDGPGEEPDADRRAATRRPPPTPAWRPGPRPARARPVPRASCPRGPPSRAARARARRRAAAPQPNPNNETV